MNPLGSSVLARARARIIEMNERRGDGANSSRGAGAGAARCRRRSVEQRERRVVADLVAQARAHQFDAARQRQQPAVDLRLQPR
jgi:hypothetical protein